MKLGIIACGVLLGIAAVAWLRPRADGVAGVMLLAIAVAFVASMFVQRKARPADGKK
jgi:hypothetical protein